MRINRISEENEARNTTDATRKKIVFTGETHLLESVILPRRCIV
jgi:hypothetical protein